MAQLLRPFPQFGTVTSTSATWASSRYHALQARIEKRYSSGLTVTAAYTYSKLMDNSSGVLVGGEALSNGTVQDWNNLRADWSSSVLDQTHRLVTSAVYELPGWKRKVGVVSRILSGWQLSGIASFFSGSPLSLTTATDSSRSLGGRQRPNWTGLSAALRSPTAQHWFDTAQFSQPAAFTFGTTARTLNGLRSDGAKNLDVGIVKSEKVSDRLRLQFRADAFNLFNRVQYAPPNTIFGSRAFGVVGAMENQPRIIQVAVKLIH